MKLNFAAYLALFTLLFAPVQAQPRKYPPNELVTNSHGESYDKDLAAKVRELATSVIETGVVPGKIRFDPNAYGDNDEEVQHYFAGFTHNKIMYRIDISNVREGGSWQFADMIKISRDPFGRKKRDHEYTDSGLNGNCSGLRIRTPHEIKHKRKCDKGYHEALDEVLEFYRGLNQTLE